MTSFGELLPSKPDAARTAALKKRLLPLGYFSAIAVGTVGWLWAIGWTILAVAKWLLV